MALSSATPNTFKQQVSTQEDHQLHTEIEQQVDEILPQLDIESLKMSISDLKLEEGMVPVALVSRQGEPMDLEVLNTRTSELPSFGQRRREHTSNTNQLHSALLSTLCHCCRGLDSRLQRHHHPGCGRSSRGTGTLNHRRPPPTLKQSPARLPSPKKIREGTLHTFSGVPCALQHDILALVRRVSTHPGAYSMQQQLAQKDRRSSPIHHKPYDALILGGGFSACLLAARILRQHPNWHIALIEESSRWGGRHCAPLSSSDALQRHHHTQVPCSSPWGYGLHGLPQESMQLIQNTFEVETPAEDSFWPLESLGYLQGSELHRFTLGRLTSPQTLGFFEGPKQGARLAAEFSQWQQQWAPSPEKIQHLLHKKKALPALLESSRQAYPRLFEHLKNAPKGGYFHSLARYLGLLVEDFLHLDGTLLIFTCRLQQLGRGQTYGPWDQMIHTWAQKTTRTSHLHLLTRTALTQRAFFQNNLWHTPTTQGEFSSRHLIVAQHCWKASSCVDISRSPASWSSAITRRSLSSQPTSMICLIARISSGSAETLRQLPQVTWLARQHAHVLRDGETLIFQALLPYENTLHAPRSSVIVRRLRRALQNLSHHLNTPLKEHFLTVLPYASPALHSPWTQTSNKKTYSSSSAEARLFFCGSSYGAYPEEWQNRWRSIDEVTTKLH